MLPSLLVPLLALLAGPAYGVAVPAAAPASAVPVDRALVGVSLEFFAFPGYTAIASTANCLANLGRLRGASPPVRIGGTTQCAKKDSPRFFFIALT